MLPCHLRDFADRESAMQVFLVIENPDSLGSFDAYPTQPTVMIFSEYRSSRYQQIWSSKVRTPICQFSMMPPVLVGDTWTPHVQSDREIADREFAVSNATIHRTLQVPNPDTPSPDGLFLPASKVNSHAASPRSSGQWNLATLSSEP
jgi:hypothetical protein